MAGLTEIEKFRLIKPLPDGWLKDSREIPFLKKESFKGVDWNNIKYASTSNMKSTKDKEKKVLLNFMYDKKLEPIYKDIIGYSRKTQDFFAITTPDFSAYRNMEPWKIEENVIHSLWCGAWMQYLGHKVILTITWADERTYDICFNYIEKGSVVAISTIGIASETEAFLKGFNEMVKRIQPFLILVRGKPIKGMEGRFIFIDFKDTFEVKGVYEQLTLFKLDKVQVIRKEGA